MIKKAYRLSVAPMMDWTDRHYRYLARQFSSKVQLYSEMITVQAVVYGDAERLLAYHADEKPLVLQFGGSDPELFAKACKIAKPYLYDAINLNAGCPSPRVSAGCFGASLRQNPDLIIECLQAMQENSDTPVSLKTRIALEEMTTDSNGYDDLCSLAEKLKKTKCKEIIVHARKARLKGLSPKQNREKLAINYDLVYQFKQDFPDLTVSINGDIKTLEQATEHLNHVDGVMIGRAAYANPALLAKADNLIYDKENPVITTKEVIEKMLPYLSKQMEKGIKPHTITRHWIGLFKGEQGAAIWRRTLAEITPLSSKDFKIVAQLINNVISSM